MANVALITDQGEPLILPAHSVEAVLTLDGITEPTGHPEAKAIIYTTFRRFSVFFLAQTATEAWAEIKSRLGDHPTDMLDLRSRGEDGCYIREHALTGLEGMRDGEERYTRLSFIRGDGDTVFTDAVLPDDERQRLVTLLLDKPDTPPGLQMVPLQPTPVPARKPSPRSK